MSARAPESLAFRYRAADAGGRIVKGRMHAAGRDEVVRRLAEDGLAAVTISSVSVRAYGPSVSVRDLAVAFRNVASLVSSGVPIERAMAVSEEMVSPALAVRLREVRRMIREGSSVAAALRSMPDAFPRSAVGVIDAGERGSTLDRACESVAEQLESEAELRSQLRSALAYPALIVLMGLATVGVMSGVVIPRFAVVLEELGAELPATTRLLLAGSAAVTRSALPLGLIVLFAIPACRTWLKNETVRVHLDRMLLGVPLLGRVRLGYASARTCRALGGMLSNGMPLLAAMDAASEATGDREISRRLGRARQAVAQGARLAEALTAERALTPLALQLVSVGEAGSTLGAMVTRAGDLAAERTERRLRAAVTMIEPLLVIALGIVVAATAAALLQAVYSVRPT